MKYTIIFISAITLFSCKKEGSVNLQNTEDSLSVSSDSPAVSSLESVAQKSTDSMINNAPKTKEVLEEGVMREEKDRVIIRMADGQRLPFTIGEKFDEKHDKLILKITDYTKPEIKASIKTKSPMNIRFNQIKIPDGSVDGPFTTEMKHNVNGKGEVWLIIGKNNMAKGATTGDFSVTVE